jgi:hypothetical protein
MTSGFDFASIPKPVGLTDLRGSGRSGAAPVN